MCVAHLDSLQPASKEILKLKQKGSINLVVFKLKQQSFVRYGIDAFQKVKKKMISVGLDVAQCLKQGKTFNFLIQHILWCKCTASAIRNKPRQ